MRATGARAVAPDEIFDVDCDIFSPNAAGGVVDRRRSPGSCAAARSSEPRTTRSPRRRSARRWPGAACSMRPISWSTPAGSCRCSSRPGFSTRPASWRGSSASAPISRSFSYARSARTRRPFASPTGSSPSAWRPRGRPGGPGDTGLIARPDLRARCDRRPERPGDGRWWRFETPRGEPRRRDPEEVPAASRAGRARHRRRSLGGRLRRLRGGTGVRSGAGDAAAVAAGRCLDRSPPSVSFPRRRRSRPPGRARRAAAACAGAAARPRRGRARAWRSPPFARRSPPARPTRSTSPFPLRGGFTGDPEALFWRLAPASARAACRLPRLRRDGRRLALPGALLPPRGRSPRHAPDEGYPPAGAVHRGGCRAGRGARRFAEGARREPDDRRHGAQRPRPDRRARKRRSREPHGARALSDRLADDVHGRGAICRRACRRSSRRSSPAPR